MRYGPIRRPTSRRDAAFSAASIRGQHTGRRRAGLTEPAEQDTVDALCAATLDAGEFLHRHRDRRWPISVVATLITLPALVAGMVTNILVGVDATSAWSEGWIGGLVTGAAYWPLARFARRWERRP